LIDYNYICSGLLRTLLRHRMIFTIISVHSNILIQTFFVKSLIELWTNFIGFLQLHYRSVLNSLILQTLRDMIKFIIMTFLQYYR